MTIWNRAPRTVLKLLLASTAQKYYISEIAELTGLAAPHLRSVLERMTTAGIVDREDERPNLESFARPLRVYYRLTPEAVDLLRL
jgi:DNA-binding transcriptional ArsR family regulator